MAVRLAAEAFEAHVATLQHALSCITNAVIVGPGRGHPTDERELVLGEQEPVPLGRRQHLFFTLRYRCQAMDVEEATWRVRPLGYLYEISNQQGRMVVAFHWHPIGRSPVTYPHLHVGCQLDEFDFSRTHVPTGAITLVDVIRFAITEFTVRPLRLDWSTVLDQARRDLSGNH